MWLSAGERGLVVASEIANKLAEQARLECERVAQVPPGIHRLGTNSVPVDESLDAEELLSKDRCIEPIPKFALALGMAFSTGLFG